MDGELQRLRNGLFELFHRCPLNDRSRLVFREYLDFVHLVRMRFDLRILC